MIQALQKEICKYSNNKYEQLINRLIEMVFQIFRIIHTHFQQYYVCVCMLMYACMCVNVCMSELAYERCVRTRYMRDVYIGKCVCRHAIHTMYVCKYVRMCNCVLFSETNTHYFLLIVL